MGLLSRSGFLSGEVAASFTLGPEQNVFTGADRTAAESARDSYFTSNPSKLAFYNDDVSLNIRLEFTSGSNDIALYQVRNSAGTEWLDNQSFQSRIGPPGIDGSDLQFASEAQRDTFFNARKDLLEANLPIQVSNGEGVIAMQYWTGDSNPPTYDNTLWSLATVRSGTGSFELATAHKLSSSGENVGFVNLLDSQSYHPVWQTFSEGNTATSRVRQTLTTNIVSDKSSDLTNPTWLRTAPVTNQSITKVRMDFVNPVTNLEILVTLNDNDYWSNRVANVPSGEQDIIFNPPFDIKSGQAIQISLSSRNGDVVVKGESTSQIPYQEVSFNEWEDVGLVTDDEIEDFKNKVNILSEGPNVSEFALLEAPDYTSVLFVTDTDELVGSYSSKFNCTNCVDATALTLFMDRPNAPSLVSIPFDTVTFNPDSLSSGTLSISQANADILGQGNGAISLRLFITTPRGSFTRHAGEIYVESGPTHVNADADATSGPSEIINFTKYRNLLSDEKLFGTDRNGTWSDVTNVTIGDLIYIGLPIVDEPGLLHWTGLNLEPPTGYATSSGSVGSTISYERAGIRTVTLEADELKQGPVLLWHNNGVNRYYTAPNITRPDAFVIGHVLNASLPGQQVSIYFDFNQVLLAQAYIDNPQPQQTNTIYLNPTDGYDGAETNGDNRSYPFQLIGDAFTQAGTLPSAQHKQIIVDEEVTLGDINNNATGGSNVANIALVAPASTVNSFSSVGHSFRLQARRLDLATVSDSCTISHNDHIDVDVISGVATTSVSFDSTTIGHATLKARTWGTDISLDFSNLAAMAAGSVIRVEIDRFEGNVIAALNTIPDVVVFMYGWINGHEICSNADGQVYSYFPNSAGIKQAISHNNPSV